MTTSTQICCAEANGTDPFELTDPFHAVTTLQPRQNDPREIAGFHSQILDCDHKKTPAFQSIEQSVWLSADSNSTHLFCQPRSMQAGKNPEQLEFAVDLEQESVAVTFLFKFCVEVIQVGVSAGQKSPPRSFFGASPRRRFGPTGCGLRMRLEMLQSRVQSRDNLWLIHRLAVNLVDQLLDQLLFLRQRPALQLRNLLGEHGAEATSHF